MAPSPPSLRPPINQTVADGEDIPLIISIINFIPPVQRAKLQSSANQQPPPRPGSGSKPVNFQVSNICVLMITAKALKLLLYD